MYTAMMNNAAFNMMNNSNTMLSMVRNLDASQPVGVSALAKEKFLTMSNIQDEVTYNVAKNMQESENTQKKEWAKSFAIFS